MVWSGTRDDHGSVSVGRDPGKTLTDRRVSGIVPRRTSEEVNVLVRLVGVAALVAAGLVVAYDMSSGPSFSDGPVPSVRDALSCEGRVYATRQIVRAEQGVWQPSPESALQAGLQLGEQWWLDPTDLRTSVRKETRVVFVHDVAGRARFAALVERGPRDHIDEWRLSSWAMCEPSELTGDDADNVGYGVWLDAGGDPVPISEVMTLRGPEHCGWEDVTFIEVDRDVPAIQQFVHDPSGELDDRLRTTYAERAGLPSDALDTGWRRGGLALWLQPRGDAAYLVNLADPTDVERWPRAKRTIGCA